MIIRRFETIPSSLVLLLSKNDRKSSTEDDFAFSIINDQCSSSLAFSPNNVSSSLHSIYNQELKVSVTQ